MKMIMKNIIKKHKYKRKHDSQNNYSVNKRRKLNDNNNKKINNENDSENDWDDVDNDNDDNIDITSIDENVNPQPKKKNIYLQHVEYLIKFIKKFVTLIMITIAMMLSSNHFLLIPFMIYFMLFIGMHFNLNQNGLEYWLYDIYVYCMIVYWIVMF